MLLQQAGKYGLKNEWSADVKLCSGEQSMLHCGLLFSCHPRDLPMRITSALDQAIW